MMPTTAMVLQPIDELVVIGVRPVWLALPVEWREGLAYWGLAHGVMLQDGVRPVGPPRNIEWTFASQPQEVLNIQLRHPCPACRASIDEAAEKLAEAAEKLAEPSNRLVLGIAQFTIDYLRTTEEIANDDPRRIYRVGTEWGE